MFFIVQIWVANTYFL